MGVARAGDVLPAGRMPAVHAGCRELANHPITPIHSACWETVTAVVPPPGALITHRNSRYRPAANRNGHNMTMGGTL